MHEFMKKIIICFVCFSLIGIMPACRSRSKGPYNPFLKMKTKPSQIQMRADKKALKRGNKAYKRHLGDSRKHLFGRRTAPGT